MVKTGQARIRRVRFDPPPSSAGSIEVNTLTGIRERGGPHEFLTPQRLDFDLVVQVESGTAGHTVDFTDYVLQPGDLLWVRAGQVHQWGEIDDIEGPVVMFGSYAVGDSTRELVSVHLRRPQNHWPAADLAGTPVRQSLAVLTATGALPATELQDVRQTALAHSLAALLAQLVLTQSAADAPVPGPVSEVFRWFRDHIDEHFRTMHTVTEYADRLGYSARTLNRLAREHTGLSAKQLVDERIALEAKRQLNHADASVAEIAEELGFDDASNFSSWFRRQTGMTPGTFRSSSRARTTSASTR